MSLKFNTKKLGNIETSKIALGNFKGIDLCDTPLNVSKNRATDLLNYEFRSGVNQKRNGYSQIAKVVISDSGVLKNPKINGFWSFTDTYGTKHCVIHAGTKIYDIGEIKEDITEQSTVSFWNSKDITNSCTYHPSFRTETLAQWKQKVTSGIKDRLSYGVVRGNRLYILCGIYLVYSTWNDGSTWELRPVEDNIDTYVPYVQILTPAYNRKGEVSNNGGYQTSIDHSNLLSSRVNVTLMGEPTTSDLLNEQETYDVSSFIKDNAKDLAGNSLTTTNVKELNGYVKGFKKSELAEIKVPIKVTNTTSNAVSTFAFTLTISNDSVYTYSYVGEEAGVSAFNALLGANANTCIDKFYAHVQDTRLGCLVHISVGSNTCEIDLSESTVKIADSVKLALIYNLSLPMDLTKTSGISVLQNDNDNTSLISTITENRGYNSSNELVCKFEETKITFYKNCIPAIKGSDNITVTYCPKRENNLAEKINGCKFGCIFGYNDAEFLFVSGNTNYKNYDWHTEYPYKEEQLTYDTDLTFFGDVSYSQLGSAMNPITGYLVLGDSNMIVLKKQLENDHCCWYRSCIKQEVKINDLTSYTKITFSQLSTAIPYGCVNNNCVGTLTNDKLFFNGSKLYGVALSTNINTNERYALSRSSFLGTELQEQDMEKASIIVFNDKLYLANGNGNVYVADSKFKTTTSVDSNDTFSYEFYKWNNINVRNWVVINNQLGFFDEYGGINLFNNVEKFEDTTYEILEKTQGYTTNIDSTLNEDSDPYTIERFTVVNDKKSLIKDNEEVTIFGNNYKEFLCFGLPDEDNVFTVDSDTFFHTLRWKEGVKVYAIDADSPLATPVEGVVSDLDDELFTFTFSSDVALDTTKHYYIVADLYEKQKILVDPDNEQRFYIENEIVNGIRYYKKIYCYSNSSLSFAFAKNTNVVSYWKTPVMNLGTSIYLKNITSLTVVPDVIRSGTLKIKIETRHNEYEFNAEGIDYNDNENVNFLSFSFDRSQFARSYTKKLKIKKFNFIQLTLSSDDNTNSIINEVNMLYTVGRKTRGVM